MDSRWVLHLDMDAFFASVEQLTRPTLRAGRCWSVGWAAGCGGRRQLRSADVRCPLGDADAPGAPAGGYPRGGVAAARRGVRGGQSACLRHGARSGGRCRTAFLRRGIRRTPELAGASVVDVERFCEDLRRRVREETGLIASVGAGSGKQIAKIASGLAKPDGVRVIRRADERALLAGLPVRRLWGIGPVAEEKLHRLGIETIGQLAALTEAEVANILGATIGPALHRLARGIDDRPVAERAEAKQISAESTFPADLTTLDQLGEAIGPIAEHAHQRLIRDGRERALSR
ncbi:impB/mucB/samB family protein [Mycobacterium xenopi 3993]|nr:impB/mucB/samB family protein [Mycobacterium xenopi 3993]